MSGDDKNEEHVTETNPQPEPDSTTPEEGVKEDGQIEQPQPQPKRRGRKPKDPEPAVPRMVRYVTAQSTIRPAVIAGVLEDGNVELVVFNRSGAVFVSNASLAPAEDEIPGTYHWPSRD